MMKIFNSLLFKKLLSKFGFYFNKIYIHNLKFTDIKHSALKNFYFNKNSEIETFKLLKGSNYETFIDIGAYFGYFSIYAKLKSNINNVFAYEASFNNFKKLKKFIKLNKADIKIFNNAVGNKKEIVKFYTPAYDKKEKFPSHGRLIDPKSDKTDLYSKERFEIHETEMLPLKEILKKNVSGLTLIKLDIEGYEETSLRSIERELKSNNQIDLLVEILINDKNKISLFNFIRALGYNSYLLTNAGLIFEDRPLTLPKPYHDSSLGSLRTLWKDHFFTKKSKTEISELNNKIFKYNI